MLYSILTDLNLLRASHKDPKYTDFKCNTDKKNSKLITLLPAKDIKLTDKVGHFHKRMIIHSK